MSMHSLGPSPAIIYADFISGVAQDVYQNVCQRKSMAEAALCGGTRMLGRMILTYIGPIGRPLFIPSTLVASACGNNKRLLQRISWIAPVAGIGLTTAAAYVSYGLVSSTVSRGFICGAHSGALGALSAPSARDPLGMISLRSVISDWIELWLPNAETQLDFLDYRKIKTIDTQSDVIACLAFMVSNIGLTLLGGHPIVATTVGFVISTTVKVVAARILVLNYERERSAPRP